MSGVINDEVSGVFEATLNEDMMETVRKIKRPFIDCDIPKVFSPSQENYSLVYVPAPFMTYPLKKGDKVSVYFNQACYRYPVLWKVTAEYEDGYTKEISFPSAGEIVKFPSAETVLSVVKLDSGKYQYTTDSYTLTRVGDSFHLIKTDGQIINTSEFDVLSDKINLEAKQGIALQANSGNISFTVKQGTIDFKATIGGVTLKSSGTGLADVGNSVGTIGSAISEICDAISGLQTFGSPAVHSVLPSSAAVLTAIKAKYATVFK